MTSLEDQKAATTPLDEHLDYKERTYGDPVIKYEPEGVPICACGFGLEDDRLKTGCRLGDDYDPKKRVGSIVCITCGDIKYAFKPNPDFRW